MTANRRRCRPSRPSHPGGFTLLEVLLVALLSILLLGAIWSLFNVYVGLFDKGERRAQQAQLVRSLLRQISDDLEAAIQDTAARPPQLPASTPLRRFGLFGTASSLYVDTLRASPDQRDFLPKESTGTQATEEPLGPKAPDFRTVQYEFTEPVKTDLPSAATEPGNAAQQNKTTQSGLTRRELDWEIPGGAQQDAQASPGPLGSASSNSVSLASSSGSAPADLSADKKPPSDTTLVVPEVVSLAFRYFDGKTWTNQWNSIQRKSLPAAVEVTLKLKPPEGTKPRRFGDADSSDRNASTSLGPSEDNQSDSRLTVHDAAQSSTVQPEQPDLPSYRTVVYLPASPLQSPSKPPESGASPFSVHAVAPSDSGPAAPPIDMPAVDALPAESSPPAPPMDLPPASLPPIAVPPVNVPPAVLPEPKSPLENTQPAPADLHMRNQ